MTDYIRRKDAIEAAVNAFNAWNLAMAAADGTRELNLVFRRKELCKAVELVFRGAPAADVVEVVRSKPVVKVRQVTITDFHEESGWPAADGSTLYRKNMVHAEIPYKHCPVCGATLCSRWYNYCGKCGAKMDGGENDVPG